MSRIHEALKKSERERLLREAKRSEARELRRAAFSRASTEPVRADPSTYAIFWSVRCCLQARRHRSGVG